jgi:hypothetical protein
MCSPGAVIWFTSGGISEESNPLQKTVVTLEDDEQESL